LEDDLEILNSAQEWKETFAKHVLKSFEKTGELDFKNYPYAKNTDAPSGKALALSSVKLLFISSCGAYIPDSQPPFDAVNPLGDYSIRMIPFDEPLSELDYAHDHYDQAAVRKDPQTLLPVEILKDRVHSGKLGALTNNWISFMGYQPDLSRVVNETIPIILSQVDVEEPDAALLVPA
jgi:hypothetical protein